MKLKTLIASAFLLPLWVNAQENFSSSFQFYEAGSVSEVRAEQPVLLSSPPQFGTFYSAQLTNNPPWPYNPIEGADVYSFENVFIYDDRKVDYVALQAEQEAQQAEVKMFSMLLNASEGGFLSFDEMDEFDGPGPSSLEAFSYTNGLWLEIYSQTSNWLTLTLHGTAADGYYEILTKTNLSETNWTVDHGFIGQDTSTLANPIWLPGRTNIFFWARHTSLDSDGDGLPDWWETEQGLNPSLSDTGNTGTSDGYKDTDGDGWSNIEEYENGTSPTSFNTPHAPRGLTVTLNSSGTTANLAWNPSGGTVTGYTIERYYFKTGVNDFPTSATNRSYADTTTPPDLDPNYYPPTYRLQAHYAAGDSEWGDWVSVHRPFTQTMLGRVRGSGGRSYLVLSGAAPDVTGVKITWLNYNSNPPTTNSFTLPLSSFTNGIAIIPESQVQIRDERTRWAQVVLTNGSLGKFISVGNSTHQSVPFFDGREQLKQNLDFLFRAADKYKRFQLFLLSTSWNGLYSDPYATNYVVASFYNIGPTYEEYPSYAYQEEFRPFVDNYHYRNFVLDPGHLNSSGQTTTGAEDDGTYAVLHFTAAAYQFQYPTSVVSISGLLSSATTTNLIHPYYDEDIGVSVEYGTNQSYVMEANPKNFFGLSYVSAREPHDGTYTDLFPGGRISYQADYLYPCVVEPITHVLSYYFGRQYSQDQPGQLEFSPTNTTPPLLFVSGNDPEPYPLFGYAKLALDNGYTNQFGYLGLYFDKAYKVNTDGSVSTNQNGLLSEYGDYFPFEAGRVLLTTKPASIGETNIGTCLVHVIKLELDVNHDGSIDHSITGPDNTSQEKPFTFWVNNDYDRGHTVDTSDFEEDDLKIAGTPTSPTSNTPDYAYSTDVAFQPLPAIPSLRDLEDYTRLWASGLSNIMAVAPTNYTVKLTLVGDGGLRIFRAYESNGGTNYLFDGTTASNQVAQSTSLYLGLLTSDFPITLSGKTNLSEHFIWCGAKPGRADVHLQILDGNQNVVSDTVTYIQINDIKEMYERWTVGDSPGVAPKNTAYLAAEDLPPGVGSFRYGTPTDTNTPYILFVHGWNMERWEKDRFAEAAYKRLYWQGYQGRFGSFRWPTDYGIKDGVIGYVQTAFDRRNYDNSENNAWQSSVGLKNLLVALNTLYPGKIYLLAHSMGNVVAGEALSLVTNQVVNTYVASQAAVPAHTYDDSISDYSFTYGGISYGPKTPNIYKNWLVNNSSGVGRRINFYNLNDYALQRPRWEWDQLFKPNYAITIFAWEYVFDGYPYDGNQSYSAGAPDDTSPWNHFLKKAATTVNLNMAVLTNRYEVMAYAAQSRSTALGRTADVNEMNLNVNLARTLNPRIWPDDTQNVAPDQYSRHKWHSAQFRSTNMKQRGYWRALLSEQDGFNIEQP